MFHLSLYRYTSTATAAKDLVDMPGVPDPAITLVNNHPIFPQPVNLTLAYAFGQTDITDVQFQTPKLRAVALEHIRPFDIATSPTTRPPIANYTQYPIPLNRIDENSVQLSASTGTDTNNYYAGIWFSDGNLIPQAGPVYTVRFTASITATAFQWTSGAFTLQNPLPAGMYAVIGMDIYGTNLAFARLIFPNQVWRPGTLSGGVAGFINAPCFRLGKMGTWGTFDSFAQPNLDLYAIAANSSQTGVLDLVRIG